MAVDNPCAQHAGRKTTKVAMAFSLMVPPAARAVRRALLAACAKLGPPQCSSVQLERGANVSASMDSVVELYQLRFATCPRPLTHVWPHARTDAASTVWCPRGTR